MNANKLNEYAEARVHEHELILVLDKVRALRFDALDNEPAKVALSAAAEALRVAVKHATTRRLALLAEITKGDR